MHAGKLCSWATHWPCHSKAVTIQSQTHILTFGLKGMFLFFFFFKKNTENSFSFTRCRHRFSCQGRQLLWDPAHRGVSLQLSSPPCFPLLLFRLLLVNCVQRSARPFAPPSGAVEYANHVCDVSWQCSHSSWQLPSLCGFDML